MYVVEVISSNFYLHLKHLYPAVLENNMNFLQDVTVAEVKAQASFDGCINQEKEKPLLTTFVHLRELNTIFIEICFGVSTGGSLVNKVVIAEGKTL